jgi:hypothetical protein
VTLAPSWVEVVVSTRTGETYWVDRSAVRFVSWAELLVSVPAVEAIDAEATPVRVRPTDEADALSTAAAPLPPLAVNGEWLKVSIHHLADRIQPEGWIRWRRGDRLLVRYSPLS